MTVDESTESISFGPDFVRNPYPAYARLRERGPVHCVRTPEGMELWLVVGHEACRAAFVHPGLSRDWVNNPEDDHFHGGSNDSPAMRNMLTADPPVHTRLRRLVAREFTPRRIEAMAPRIQQITEGLLDEMTADGRRTADLVESLAFPLPMTVICELLGVPELDREAFRSWSNEMVSPTSPEAQAAMYTEMPAYLTGLVEAKRAEPGDDLLSGLLQTVDDDGDRLSSDELIGMCVLLLVAGHETTVNLIGNGMRALFAHPEQLAALQSDLDGLMAGAVEEMLRYDGPVEASTVRLSREDVEIDGHIIPAGNTVLIAIADADRDPERFEKPDVFDIRRDARGHIAFGHGLHYCLGAPLARLEGRIAIRALLERCPEIALDADEDALTWVPGLLMRGAKNLPVRW